MEQGHGFRGLQGAGTGAGSPLSQPDLDELLVLQVPLLDAIVTGAAEQDVPVDSQALDAVVVWGLKVVGGADGAGHTVTQLEHLGEEGRREPQSLAQGAALTMGRGLPTGEGCLGLRA